MTCLQKSRVEIGFRRGAGSRRPIAAALALLVTTSAMTIALHGVALAAGGMGGGSNGGAAGDGYEGAAGTNGTAHGGGGGGAAGGGTGGQGGPGDSGNGAGGNGGAGGYNGQNGQPDGNGQDGGNGVSYPSGPAQGGGSGGGGGAGGAGFYFYSADIDLAIDAGVLAIFGGSGGAGGKGGTKGGAGGKGGDGGGGVVVGGGYDVIVDIETITGGAGGRGGDGANIGVPGVGALGGDGGAAVLMLNGGSVTVNGTVVTGGKGGNGGDGIFNQGQVKAGDGGDGGDGIDAQGGGDIIINSGAVWGGSGGAGGTTVTGAGAAGDGGAGGRGIDAADADSVTVAAGASVTGGDGGAAGNGTGSSNGAIGLGGVGIFASNGTVVTVAGIVAGGLDSVANNRAYAVEFSGGGNTLVLESGYDFIGGVHTDGTNGGDTLTLGGSENGTFNLANLDASFGDFTSFAKAGASTWTLTGTSNFTGTTTISEGTLHLTGSMDQSDVSVGEDGTLSATWITLNSLDVVGTVKLAGGTSSYVYVNDGAKFEAGSTLSVAVEADGYGGLIYGSGNMEIEGGTVVVSAAAGVYNPAYHYNVLSGDTVTGTFDGAEMADPSFLAPTLHYTEYSAYLTFAADFSGAAETPNQARVAKALDDWGTGALVDELLATDPAEAGALFDNLSGESLGAADQSQQQTASLVTGAVTDRVTEVLNALDGAEASGYAPVTETGPADPSHSIWISGYGARASIDASAENASSITDTAGLTFGLDGEIGDWTVGVMGGYGQSANSVADLGTTIDSSDYSAGVYAGGKWDDVRAVLGAVYTWSLFDSTRDIAVPDETLTASYGGSTGSIFGEASKEFDLGVVSLTPYAGAQYTHLSGDAYEETGGNAALAVDARSADVLYTTLGLRSSADVVVGGDMLLSFGAGAGWRHAFSDDAVATHSFVAGGDSFAVSNAEVPADRLAIEASAGLDVSANLALDLSYTGEFTGSTATNQVQAGIKGAF